MSGIGFSELIILFLIGLIVLGPERLPRVANQLGSWIGQARRMTRVMKRQLEDELTLEKAPDIMPPKTDAASHEPEQEAKPETVPANEDDDTFSPAHDADAVGSGVNDDPPPEEPDEHGQEVGDDEGSEEPEPVAKIADPDQTGNGDS